jgi:hypothetical protein
LPAGSITIEMGFSPTAKGEPLTGVNTPVEVFVEFIRFGQILDAGFVGVESYPVRNNVPRVSAGRICFD